MTITSNDIRIYQSQDNTDEDTGGGSRTAIEVVDGDVNNLFPDISRVDTVVGRVNLRKIFPTVTTTNRDVYYGAHSIIRKPPTDDKVSGLLFHTDDPHDKRVDAQDRIESYVVASYLEEFYLYGSHVVNSRAVTFLSLLSARTPDAGEVYLLKEGVNEQYIRITKVTSDEVVLTYSYGGEPVEYIRRRMICEVEQPLTFAFSGSTFHPTGQLPDTADTWATQVADAAKFYGTKTLLENALQGAVTIKVDDIFEQIVPASKTQTPLVNKNALTQGTTILPTGTLISEGFAAFRETPFSVGVPIVPKSITRVGYTSYVDDGLGNIINLNAGNAVVGSVDYENGVIIQNDIEGTIVTEFEAGSMFIGESQYSVNIKVTQENVGNVYTKNISPLPSAGNLVVDYRSGGKWYRFASLGNRDNGVESIGGDANIGAGQLNDNGDGTGTVSITLSGLPDIDSSVIIQWGSIERITTPASEYTYTDSQGVQVVASIPKSVSGSLEIDLGHGNIDPSSFIMQVHTSGSYYNVTCDSKGVLSDAISSNDNNIHGRVDLLNGIVRIEDGGTSARFENIPSTNDVIIDYDYVTIVEGVTQGETKSALANPTGAGGQLPFNGYAPAVGEFTIDLGVTIDVTQLIVQLNACDKGSTGNTGGYYNRLTELTVMEFAGVMRVGRLAYYDMSAFTSLTYHALPNSSRYFEEWGNVTAAGLITLKIPKLDYKEYDPAWLDTQIGSPRYLTGSSVATLLPLTWFDHEADPTTNFVRIVYRTELPVTYDTSVNITNKIENIASYVINTTSYLTDEVSFYFPERTQRNYSKDGLVYDDNDIQVGTIDMIAGKIDMGYFVQPENLHVSFESLFTDVIRTERTVVTPETTRVIQPTELTTELTFRTSATKLTASSFQLRYETVNGSYTATTDANGVFTGADIDVVESYVDTETGMVYVKFDRAVLPESVKYDAVSETSLPLDPELLGLNPIRLPADGRVPVFKNGYMLIIFNEVTTAVVNGTPVADQVDTLARQGQAYAEVIDVNGKRLNPTQYVVDKVAGTVTFGNPLVLQDKYGTALTSPYSIVDRVEDMVLATDVQINGIITLSAPLSRDYTAGVTNVASSLIWGDTGARIYNLFTQEIWDSGNPIWSDERIGDDTTAKYDDINYPIQIDNNSSTAERWVIIFKSASTVDVVGEKLGVVESDISISVDDVAPINPTTGSPYFTMPKEGFGAGWITNNCIRLNSDSGDNNMWVIRTTKAGVLSELTDSIDIDIRGDAN